MGSSPIMGTIFVRKKRLIMKFYQYWLIIIVVVLVIITIINIAKMIMIIGKNNGRSIAVSNELNRNIRNLLTSMVLLSLIALIYIILIFKQMS
jgi:hypothetical protein